MRRGWWRRRQTPQVAMVGPSPEIRFPTMKKRKEPLGTLLLQSGRITRRTLDAALEEQESSGRRIGDVLVRRGAIDARAVADALANQLNLPLAPTPLEPQPEALAAVQPNLARSRTVLPLVLGARSITVAMANPLDSQTIDDLRFQSGRRVVVQIAAAPDVATAVAEAYGGELPALLDHLEPPRSPIVQDPQALEREARAAPIVRLVNHLLSKAIERRASDIHIETLDRGSRVRLRIDGRLHTSAELPADSHRAVISRIKIMAGLDISVRRRPQDGGFTAQQGPSSLTVRVSTIPTRGGEKAVLRILDPGDRPTDLSNLGLDQRDLHRLRGLLGQRQGLVLAAGPTGSGKTTTLAGAIGELALERANVVTLEDPVEIRIPGVAQMEIDPRSGPTFADGLRALLRQDPDVILVGEIRDRETAEIAMSAAVTGHLVLSTIHTVDAPGAVIRLLEMGVPPFLVAGGLSGVVAQRLVRRVCNRCQGRSGTGCKACVDGYRGRAGVFQVLAMTDEIRTAVGAGQSLATVRQLAQAGGMGNLGDDALRQVSQGVTTPHEAGRIIATSRTTTTECPHCGEEGPAGLPGCPHCGERRTATCGCGCALRRTWRYCPGCFAPTGWGKTPRKPLEAIG